MDTQEPDVHATDGSDPPHPGPGWYGRNEISDVFGTSPQNFDKTYRPLAPPEAIRTIGRRVFFHARSMIDAYAAARVATAKRRTPTEEDMLEAGVTSPALERFRSASADIKEMERDRQRGSLIPTAEIEPPMMQLAGILRGAGDKLTREFGNPAGEILNEAIDEWERGLVHLFDTIDAKGGAANEPE